MALPCPPPPRSLFDLEITVLCAEQLKNINWRNGDLKPYAVAYLDPDRRSATRPDNCGSTEPVWNERLTLPLDATAASWFLTLEILHSERSETPKPLVGTAKVPLVDLIDLGDLSISPINRRLDLRLRSGRPQGKVWIRTALRQRPLPPPPPEQNHEVLPLSAYYYSPAPPPFPSHHLPSSHPPPYGPYPPPYAPNPPPYAYSDPYSGYHSVSGGAGAGGGGFYLARPMYYEGPGGNFDDYNHYY